MASSPAVTVICRHDVEALVEFLDSLDNNYYEGAAVESAVLTLPSGAKVLVAGENASDTLKEVSLTVTL